ncbi:methyltransferase domain-containing protein [bacterium]|nr:MAG: methyltransferase domain-containing protein [bacterium]
MTSSQTQFDRQAAMYATSTVHRSGPSLPVLVDLAAVQNGERALDVATGTGNTAFAIAEKGAVVTGVDISAGMLAQARERAQREGVAIDFVEGSAENLPFPDASFDLVTVRHAPHHFHDVPQFLREVRRVLAPGGRFVMSDGTSPTVEASAWFDRWQRLRDPSHFYSRTVEEWQMLADDADFVWQRHTIVPYRLEFDWWTKQSGCSPETVATLVEHAQSATPSIREAVGLEIDENDRPIAFHEPMLVVRLDRMP